MLKCSKISSLRKIECLKTKKLLFLFISFLVFIKHLINLWFLTDSCSLELSNIGINIVIVEIKNPIINGSKTVDNGWKWFYKGYYLRLDIVLNGLKTVE